jgi:hypothetical protein
MPEEAFVVIHLRYVFDPELGLTADHKAALVGLSVRGYWMALSRAEMWIWARLDGAPPEHNAEGAQVPGTEAKPLGGDLQSGTKRATRPAQTVRLPDLCLSALGRPTLHLTRRR